MGTQLRSYLDVLREIEHDIDTKIDVILELEAENYTMRIAAKRSLWKYRLEAPNPQFWMVYEGVQARSGGGRVRATKIARLCKACLDVLMDLEAQTLSELNLFNALSIYIGFGSRFY